MSPRQMQCLRTLRLHPEGVTTSMFLKAGCGSRFGARLHELRQMGAVISERRVRAGESRYKLTKDIDSERGSSALHNPPAGGPLSSGPVAVSLGVDPSAANAGAQGLSGILSAGQATLFESDPEPWREIA